MAVTNVIRNAVEVMPEGGTLTIRTSGVASALRSWAAIVIEDTGPGIARGDADRISSRSRRRRGRARPGHRLRPRGPRGDIAVETSTRAGRFTFLLPIPIL
jgi:signal transduction histidine kinase